MQHDIFAQHFAQRTFVEEELRKHREVVERHILCIRPVERELISAVGIVGEIACIDTIGDNEQLDIVEQAVKRCLVIALNLVVGLFQFHATFLQLYLHKWQAINKDGHIITALLPAFDGYLIGDLKLILTPLVTVQKLYPNALAVCSVQWVKVTKFLGFLETSATFKVDEYLVKLLCRELRPSMFRQLPVVVPLQLAFEIGLQIFLLSNLDIFIVHLL